MALAATLGSDTLELINKSKVLVVGAGGIGCEVLKNLVSTGFKEIETIDLDTIDVSNLNRQFLFRKCHVGKSKAKIACDAVKEFDPSITIKGHLGNIFSSDFGPEYFSKFDIVLNALDNISARRHVNRLCLSTKISFIESGTQGFVGQVNPIIPQRSQCWECTPKDNNRKTYPVCTIRSTPSEPVHCIVWAKLVFALLFGPKDDSNMIKDLKVEKKESENVDEFVKNTFTYLYDKDIEEQLSMEDKWKNRKKPITIKLNKYSEKLKTKKDGKTNTMKVLNVEENILNFMETLKKLLDEKKKIGEMVFDKDHNVIMSFVSSAANLRMHCYGIETKSEFDNKGIAGNIVHAIATTNAIVAGVMVVQAIHTLKRNQTEKKLNKKSEKEDENKNVDEKQNDNVEDKEFDKYKKQRNELKQLSEGFVWVKTNGPRWLYPMNLEAPNPKCFICQKSMVHVTLNSLKFNYGDFVKKILQKHFGFKQPDITIEFIKNNKNGSNYLESILEDEDEEEKKEKEGKYKLCLDDTMIKIYDQSKLSIEDFSQDVNVNAIIHYLDLDEEKHPNQFKVTNDYKLDYFTVNEKKQDVEKEKENKDDETNDDKKKENKLSGKKRKNMDEDENDKITEKVNKNEPPAKKAKTSH